MLFSGATHYAEGGMNDFTGSFDNLGCAFAFPVDKSDVDWQHIYDQKEGAIIYELGPEFVNGHIASKWKKV